MFDLKEIEKTVKKNSGSSPCGAFAVFVKLNEQWGIKLYSQIYERDNAHENQLRAYEQGLAPEVGPAIDLPTGDDRYGYLTEIVEVCPNLDGSNAEKEYERNHGSEAFSEAVEKRAEWLNDMRQDQDILRDIVNKIWTTTGWRFEDTHLYNWGRKDGQWMPIDFG